MMTMRDGTCPQSLMSETTRSHVFVRGAFERHIGRYARCWKLLMQLPVLKEPDFVRRVNWITKQSPFPLR